ncbi:hypothetical protein KG112_07785 [Nocardioides sp. zg-ZUI104]|uniref:hypothetical protein n=1 Tax=Nocardioides faecalis TaxID=2803858 RepID=UPI001BD08312|nr:hypothetical protein [Nocardioides faecalis]MBS4752708.1 hypothetical protein [Nocardioides faecalis]
MRLSLLDRSRTRADHPDGAALGHTADRAIAAERAGYHWFWVAEHRGSRPSVIASLDVLIADTDAEARDLALPEVCAMAQSRRTGLFEALEPVATIRDRLRDDRLADRVERALDRVGAGTPATVPPARSARRADRRRRAAGQSSPR